MAGRTPDEGPDPTKKIKDVQKKVDEVSGVLKENIDLAIKRGEQLEVIEDKSKQLEEGAHKFQKNARAARQMFCRRHAKMIIIIVGIVLVIIGIIVAIALGKN